MHTTTIGTTTFHHNGDFGGDIIITVDVIDGSTVTVAVPFSSVLGLVAKYVRMERDNLSDREVLGLPPKPEA